MDKSVKLWDLSNNEPSCIATHQPNAVRTNQHKSILFPISIYFFVPNHSDFVIRELCFPFPLRWTTLSCLLLVAQRESYMWVEIR